MRFGITAAIGAALAVSCVVPAQAISIGEKTAEKQAEIPTCSHKIGTLAVREPQNQLVGGAGPGIPRGPAESLCDEVRLLHPGRSRHRLRDGAAGTRPGRAAARCSKAPMSAWARCKAADYILVPDIVSKNGNASGTNIGGILGGFIGGGVGALVSSINISSKTADVVLTITNVRTSEQQAMEEGHGSKTDLGFGFGGGWGGWGGFGGAGISNYQNTDIGQVVVLAYIDAYTKLVGDLGGLGAAGRGGRADPGRHHAASRTLYTSASEKSKVVRPLDAGMILYPTGNKDGVWWEVKDELGNEGWVSSLSLALAK